MSVKKESEEITFNREEILRTCIDFYNFLMNQTVPTPEGTMKSSPDRKMLHIITEKAEKSHSKDKKTKLMEKMELQAIS